MIRELVIIEAIFTIFRRRRRMRDNCRLNTTTFIRFLLLLIWNISPLFLLCNRVRYCNSLTFFEILNYKLLHNFFFENISMCVCVRFVFVRSLDLSLLKQLFISLSLSLHELKVFFFFFFLKTTFVKTKQKKIFFEWLESHKNVRSSSYHHVNHIKLD